MQTHSIERGLNDLSLFTREQKRQDSDCRSFSSFMTPPGSFLSHSASSSTMIGDYIGMESCIDVLSDGDQLDLSDRGRPTAEARAGETATRCRGERRTTSLREFPPPIPSLAQTENLQSRMPWVLRRHYTGDGRLILTEEKVRHHEYFRAHRSNGRLTLHLVPLDGAVLNPSLADGNNNEEITEEEMSNVEDEKDNDDENLDDQDDCVDCGEMDGGDDDEEEECNDKNANEQQGIGSSSGGKSCYNYSGGHCILRVPVPAVRPVHS